jgi:hypothetical protein
MEQPNYEDISRMKEVDKFISSITQQNLIIAPHVEGTIQYIYVLANASKENNDSLDEFKTKLKDETKIFREFINNAKGEVGDADKGINIGLLFVEKIISKSKDFNSFYDELDRYVTSNQKARMMYHKMKFLDPDTRLETLSNKVVDGLD